MRAGSGLFPPNRKLRAPNRLRFPWRSRFFYNADDGAGRRHYGTNQGGKAVNALESLAQRHQVRFQAQANHHSVVDICAAVGIVDILQVGLH